MFFLWQMGSNSRRGWFDRGRQSHIIGVYDAIRACPHDPPEIYA
jgi:hypothetical protein